jgi:hypothetical protein
VTCLGQRGSNLPRQSNFIFNDQNVHQFQERSAIGQS